MRKLKVRHPKLAATIEELGTRISHITRLVEESNEGRRDLWGLLANTQPANCFDPRDRIDAQLSMLPNALQSMLVPSYHKTVRKVYIDAFLAFNAYEERKNLLGQCQEQAVLSNLDLPSWVPNWSYPRKINWSHVTAAFNACGPSTREIQYNDNGELLVKGSQSDAHDQKPILGRS